MPRDGSIVRARLQESALDLFLERGYDLTTAANIAEHAGVTERTFFRHFPDKREVFFDGEQELRDAFVSALAGEMAAGVEPLPMLLAAFHEAVPVLERNRQVARARAGVIQSTPALLERQLTKTAVLIEVLARALEEHGVGVRLARLIARIGMDLFSVAIERWNEGEDPELHGAIDAVFDELSGLADSLRPRGHSAAAGARPH